MTHEELIDRAARLFKVLGNSLRIHILFYLRKHGESPVSAIVGHLGVSQPVISKQLGILKKNTISCRNAKQALLSTIQSTTRTSCRSSTR